MPKTNANNPKTPPTSPLRNGIGEYANNAVIIMVITHNLTPFFLVNNLEECFIDFPQAIVITNPKIKTITPRISISIPHNLLVKKLNRKIAIPITHNQIPFFLASHSIIIIIQTDI